MTNQFSPPNYSLLAYNIDTTENEKYARLFIFISLIKKYTNFKKELFHWFESLGTKKLMILGLVVEDDQFGLLGITTRGINNDYLADEEDDDEAYRIIYRVSDCGRITYHFGDFSEFEEGLDPDDEELNDEDTGWV